MLNLIKILSASVVWSILFYLLASFITWDIYPSMNAYGDYMHYRIIYLIILAICTCCVLAERKMVDDPGPGPQ